MINSQVLSRLNLKGIGIHLSRPRSQHGELSESMPKRGRLARGQYWARWRIYVRQSDGKETSGARKRSLIERSPSKWVSCSTTPGH